MIKWIKSLFQPKVDTNSIIITSTMGIGQPIPVLNKQMIECACSHCGRTWKQVAQTPFIYTDATYVYSKCTQCSTTKITIEPYPQTDQYTNPWEITCG